MKYLKKYEEILDPPRYKKGDIVCVIDTEGIFKVADVDTTENVFGHDESDNHYVYKLKGDNDSELNYDWLEAYEFDLATEEDIIKISTNKYNI